MQEQIPMFDVPDYPVTRPDRPPRYGLPIYRRLNERPARDLCDDCILVLSDGNWRGPSPLTAGWIRLDEDGPIRLCHPHVQAWVASEDGPLNMLYPNP